MRVDVTPLEADLQPNIPQLITVTISNTETVIAGYTIRILGADPAWVQPFADTVSLFPDETRTVTVTIDVPRGLPAGSRRIAVQVRELTIPWASQVTEIDLTVAPNPLVQLRVDPVAVTGGRRAGFSLLVENTGNTDILGVLAGGDPENQVSFVFEPDRVHLAPGQHAVADMRVGARRRIFGAPTVRTLALYLDEVPPDAFFTDPDGDRAAAAVPVATSEERESLAAATFIQKSVAARGALSLVGLLLAATVFAIVITLALSRLVAQSTADRNLALQVAAAQNSTATTGQSGVSGTVALLTSGKPVPGVTVTVFAASDTATALATTATNAKGAYSITDLPAGKYVLSFRGAGFVQIYFPQAADVADATAITLATSQVRAGIDVTLGGVPASIAGTVLGDDVSAATLFLETLPTGSAPAVTAIAPARTGNVVAPVVPPDNGGAVVQRVPIGSDGSFSLTNVPSPSVYDLVVVKAGYATSTQRIDIGAGESRTGVNLTLSKGDGLITGTVTSQSRPLGGATVTATSGQQTANTVTLNGAGAGTFTLRQLPTPATFTLVASAPHFSSQTITVSLTAGQKLTGVSITLTASSGSLAGTVRLLPSDRLVPGVGVTVTDGAVTFQTATRNAGVTGSGVSGDGVGTWSVTGLPLPDVYTVTFTRSDLQSQTVSVSLDASGNVTPGSLGTRVTSSGISVTMQSATATLSGTITQPGGTNACEKASDRLGEAVVTLSSGSTSYTVTSASESPNCGRYRIEQILPGTYTLSASAGTSTSPSSRVITLRAGARRTKDVELPPPASISGTVTGCTDTGNAGCDGYTVFLYAQTGYPATYLQAQRVTGQRYAFDDIDAGDYILAVGPTANPLDATTTVPVTLRPSKPRTVDIEVSQ